MPPKFPAMPVRLPFVLPLLLMLGFLAGCRRDSGAAAGKGPATSDNLRYVGEYPLLIAEPSGLSLSRDKLSLWTASDEDGKIYQMTLEGKILRSFDSGMTDVEGIAVVDDGAIAVMSERSHMISIFTPEGKLLQSTEVAFDNADNDGPEGLEYDPVDQRFYVLKEKSPGQIIVLDHDLKEISRRQLKFARDYSSLSYEPERSHLWIMSDESNSITVMDLAMQMQTSYSTSILQQEGLALDYEKRRLYIVSDAKDMLYAYDFDSY